MFHGDKSAAASKCFVPSGALFSPLGASRFPSKDIGSGCRCITNRAPDIRIVLYIYLRMRNNRAPPLLHSLANLPPDVITRAITGRQCDGVYETNNTDTAIDNRIRGGVDIRFSNFYFFFLLFSPRFEFFSVRFFYGRARIKIVYGWMEKRKRESILFQGNSKFHF